MLTNVISDDLVDQRLDTTKRAASALDLAGVRHRVVGGWAVFLHVDAVDPILARMTPDIDLSIERNDLDAARAAFEAGGFKMEGLSFRYVDPARRRSAIHLVFLNENVQPDDLEPVPCSEPVRTPHGFLIAPLSTWFI